MTPAEWSSISEIANVLVMVATAVWAVSRIKGTTEKLGITMEHLRSTVERLDLRFETTARELVSLRERVSIMETKQSLQSAEVCRMRVNQDESDSLSL